MATFLQDGRELLTEDVVFSVASVVEQDIEVTSVMAEAMQSPQLAGSTQKALIAEGEFGRVDVPTGNGRIYECGMMRDRIQKLQPKIRQGMLYGEGDHPAEGKTSWDRITHLVTEWQEPRADGSFHGKLILLDTANRGHNVIEAVRKGGKFGLSIRGAGTTTARPDGMKQVNEDYELFTVDIVVNPSVVTAIPSVRESMESARSPKITEDMQESKMTLAELTTAHPELVEQIRLDARTSVLAEVDAKLKLTCESAEAKIRKDERESNDARLKTACEELERERDAKLKAACESLDAERDAKLKAACEEMEAELLEGMRHDAKALDEAKALATRMGALAIFLMETEDLPGSEKVRLEEALGDLTAFDSKAVLKSGIASARTKLRVRTISESQRDDSSRTRIRELEAKNARLQEDLSKLGTKLAESTAELCDKLVEAKKSLSMLEAKNVRLTASLNESIENGMKASLMAYRAQSCLSMKNPTGAYDRLTDAGSIAEIDRRVRLIGEDQNREMNQLRARLTARGAGADALLEEGQFEDNQ